MIKATESRYLDFLSCCWPRMNDVALHKRGINAETLFFSDLTCGVAHDFAALRETSHVFWHPTLAFIAFVQSLPTLFWPVCLFSAPVCPNFYRCLCPDHKTSLDPTVIIWLLLFNCDSELGVAKPEIPVLALWEHENDILAAWQFISSLFSEILLKSLCSQLVWPRKLLGLYDMFCSMVHKWCETLLFLFTLAVNVNSFSGYSSKKS